MSIYDDMPLSLTATLMYETDFTFSRNVGDIANRLRSKFRLKGGVDDVALLSINIDDDGDISLKTNKCTAFVGPNRILIIGWLTTPKTLSSGQHLQELQTLVDSLSAEKSPLLPDSYIIRLFVIARFISRQGLKLIKARFSDNLLQSVFGSVIPAEINGYKLKTSLTRGVFSDSLEVEGSFKEVQLRYTRQAEAHQFRSYLDFLETAALGSLTEDLRGLIEPLVIESNSESF